MMLIQQRRVALWLNHRQRHAPDVVQDTRRVCGIFVYRSNLRNSLPRSWRMRGCAATYSAWPGSSSRCPNMLLHLPSRTFPSACFLPALPQLAQSSWRNSAERRAGNWRPSELRWQTPGQRISIDKVGAAALFRDCQLQHLHRNLRKRRKAQICPGHCCRCSASLLQPD